MIYTSCAPSNMYRNGAWYDDPALLNEFSHGDASRNAPETVAEIFPPYRYDRGDPMLIGGGEQELEHVRSVARSTLRDFTAGPATVLARAEDCCVSRSVVYLLRDDRTYVVYETHRPNDRAVAHLRHDNEIRLVEDYRRSDPFVAHLWIGSAGSMNYGHWLVDDLPRLRALTELRRLRPYARIVILSPDCGPQHNAVHAESAGAVAASLGIENVELVTVDREARVFFQELYFVTPVTNHPVLKSPDAMDFVADTVVSAIMDETESPDDALPKRLFVKRGWTGKRDLVNQAEIVDMLASHGFQSVDTEQMPVLLQAKLFGAADMVIGCMGAAMTNALFCAPGARIGQIGPQGWIETFYWDLAAVRRHHYAACYGLSTPQPAPAWQKNFRVNPADVSRMIDHLDTSGTSSATSVPKARDPFVFPSHAQPPAGNAMAPPVSKTFDPFGF